MPIKFGWNKLRLNQAYILDICLEDIQYMNVYTVKLQLESHIKMSHLEPQGESNCNMMMFL